MKKQIIATILTVMFIGSAFAFTQSDKNVTNTNIDIASEIVDDQITDGTPIGLELLTYNSSTNCLGVEAKNLAAGTSIPYRTAAPDEDRIMDCKQCRSGELCVNGKCISLQRIERESGERFDSACARTRCEEGEACVAGNCFQLASHERMESGSCTGVDCKEGQACYRGVCYDAVDENNNPVQCFSGDVD